MMNLPEGGVARQENEPPRAEMGVHSLRWGAVTSHMCVFSFLSSLSVVFEQHRGFMVVWRFRDNR